PQIKWMSFKMSNCVVISFVPNRQHAVWNA
ncbi:hypothetical protein D046_4134B, partial [Vibrio parahaemolyticus V-223/04]